MALIVVVLAEVVVNESFADALVQRERLAPVHSEAAFALLLTIGLVLAALLLALTGPISRAFGEPRIVLLLQLGCAAIVVSALSSVPVALLRRELSFRALAAVQLGAVIAGGAAGIGTALGGLGAASLMIQLLTVRVILAAGAWIACGWRPRGLGSKSALNDIRGFGLKTLALRLTLNLQTALPRYVAGTAIGPAALGFYTAAARLRDTAKALVVDPLAKVTMPAVARSQDDPVTLAALVADASRWTGLVALPSMAGLALIAPQLLPALLGESWRGAVPAAQVLAVAGIAASMTAVNMAALLGAGYAGWRLAIAVGQAVLVLVLLALVANRGVLYIALAVAVTYFVMWPIKLVLVNRVVGVPALPQCRALVVPLLATLLMSGAVLLWRELAVDWLGDLGLLATKIAIGIVTYAGVLALLAPRLLRDIVARIQAFRSAAGA